MPGSNYSGSDVPHTIKFSNENRASPGQEFLLDQEKVKIKNQEICQQYKDAQKLCYKKLKLGSQEMDNCLLKNHLALTDCCIGTSEKGKSSQKVCKPVQMPVMMAYQRAEKERKEKEKAKAAEAKKSEISSADNKKEAAKQNRAWLKSLGIITKKD